MHFAASVPSAMRSHVVDDVVDEFNSGDVDLHQMVADLAGITRKQAKTVNLGIMYGMGVAKLADQLGIPAEDAKDLIKRHRSKVPFVKQLADMATKQADKNGQIRTLLGRKCRFPLWEPTKFGVGKPLSSRGRSEGVWEGHQTSLYIQGAQPFDPRISSRPNQEGHA